MALPTRFLVQDLLSLEPGDEVHFGPVELVQEDRLRFDVVGSGHFHIGLLSSTEFSDRYSDRRKRTAFRLGSSFRTLRRTRGITTRDSYWVVIRNPAWEGSVEVDISVRLSRQRYLTTTEGQPYEAPDPPAPLEPRFVSIVSGKLLAVGAAAGNVLLVFALAGIAVATALADVYAVAVSGGAAIAEVIVADATLALALATYFSFAAGRADAAFERARRKLPPF